MSEQPPRGHMWRHKPNTERLKAAEIAELMIRLGTETIDFRLKGGKVRFDVSNTEALAIVGGLQLALRHPKFEKPEMQGTVTLLREIVQMINDTFRENELPAHAAAGESGELIIFIDTKQGEPRENIT